MEPQTTPPEGDTTQQPPSEAKPSAGDDASMEATFMELVARKQREIGPEKPLPAKVGEVAKRSIENKPQLTPEQLERLQRQRAEAALRQQESERRSKWLSLIGIRGRRYAHCTLSNYEITCQEQQEAIDAAKAYADEMDIRCGVGEGVVLFGPVGTGKDHILTALMRVAVMEHGKTVHWDNGMDLFGDIRDRMDTGESERRYIESKLYHDVLVISDPLPPKGELTQHQASMLFRIIDARYSSNKPTWVSFNAKDRADAEVRMGVSLVDRLGQGALVLFCNWDSYRKG